MSAMARPPGERGLRASDADRDATAAVLRASHAEGRLDTDELEERSERCYAAKTLDELDELVRDLPSNRPYGPRRTDRRPGRAWHPARFAPVIALLVAIAFVTDGEAMWLAWPLAFFAFARLRRAGHRRRPLPFQGLQYPHRLTPRR
jgi:hypothetical protein